MGLGARSVLKDLGSTARICVMTDSSAAKGMASRKGFGKVRHVEVNELWVQQKVGSGEIELKKVEGVSNLADALTKHVDQEGIQKHLEDTHQWLAGGRHEFMPQVAIDES